MSEASTSSTACGTVYDEHYYFPELVVFAIEKRLFRIPKHPLIASSSLFTSRFSFFADPDAPNIKSAAFSRSDTIKLSGVTVNEFRSFLSFLYPAPAISTGSPPAPSQGDYFALLKLSSMWGFNDFRKLAINALSALSLSPITKISWGRTHNIPSWILSGYEQLVTGYSLFPDADAQAIGWESAFRLCRIRELWLQGKISVLLTEKEGFSLQHHIYAAFEEEFDRAYEVNMRYLSPGERKHREGDIKAAKKSIQLIRSQAYAGPTFEPLGQSASQTKDKGSTGTKVPNPTTLNRSTGNGADFFPASSIKKDPFAFAHIPRFPAGPPSTPQPSVESIFNPVLQASSNPSPQKPVKFGAPPPSPAEGSDRDESPPPPFSSSPTIPGPI